MIESSIKVTTVLALSNKGKRIVNSFPLFFYISNYLYFIESLLELWIKILFLFLVKGETIMLVREGNKISVVIKKVANEKATKVKDIFGLDNAILDDFVKPLHVELKKILPKGMEPDIEYDLDACECNIDARSLGQKLKDLVNLKGWNGGVHNVATVTRKKNSGGYEDSYDVRLWDGSFRKNGMSLKDAMNKIIDAYKNTLSKINKNDKDNED